MDFSFLGSPALRKSFFNHNVISILIVQLGIDTDITFFYLHHYFFDIKFVTVNRLMSSFIRTRTRIENGNFIQTAVKRLSTPLYRHSSLWAENENFSSPLSKNDYEPRAYKLSIRGECPEAGITQALYVRLF